MKRKYLILFTIYFFTAFYTIVRYHLFGGVLWKDLPVFTLNKIVIFSAMITSIVLLNDNITQQEKRFFYKTIYISVALHLLLSLQVLKPYYLKDFFDAKGGYSFWGNWSLLWGILAAMIFFLGKKTNILSGFFVQFFFIFVGLHLIFIGFNSWIEPSMWYGGMPPVTLLSFLIIAYRLWHNNKY